MTGRIGNLGVGVQNPTIMGLTLQNATLKLDPYWFWYVQVASTPQDIDKGLSGVSSLPLANGLFCDTGAIQNITVTAKQSSFSIGVVFFDNDLRVVEVVSNMNPGDTYTSTAQARFYLECNPNEVVGITLGLVAVLSGYTPASEKPAIPQKFRLEDWLPISPMVGPPLPKWMGAKWPWI